MGESIIGIGCHIIQRDFKTSKNIQKRIVINFFRIEAPIQIQILKYKGRKGYLQSLSHEEKQYWSLLMPCKYYH
jgi:hypothetical protein